MKGWLSLSWLVLVLLPLTAALQAQNQGEVGFLAGGVKMFLDEPIEPYIGGQALVSVSRRLMVGPDIYFIRGARFERVNLVGRLEYTPQDAGRVRGYLVAAGGFYRELDKPINYVHYEESFGGGAGLKVRFGRLLLVPEAMLRIGEFPRLSFGARYAF
ncbi:MAG: hypothetical protein EHM61_21960 [Acidobacteria bacterium]|nr:MAG: hypothetical protein EHM61_21960 [Acidobacteriota bacterium]